MGKCRSKSAVHQKGPSSEHGQNPPDERVRGADDRRTIRRHAQSHAGQQFIDGDRQTENRKYVTVTTVLPPLTVDAMAAHDDLR
ncbi:hypothetical protein D3C72_1266030 [compost metagenome]